MRAAVARRMTSPWSSTAAMKPKGVSMRAGSLPRVVRARQCLCKCTEYNHLPYQHHESVTSCFISHDRADSSIRPESGKPSTGEASERSVAQAVATPSLSGQSDDLHRLGHPPMRQFRPLFPLTNPGPRTGTCLESRAGALTPNGRSRTPRAGAGAAPTESNVSRPRASPRRSPARGARPPPPVVSCHSRVRALQPSAPERAEVRLDSLGHA